MLDRVKGIIFDLDGTLIDSMGVWWKIDVAYLGKWGIEPPANLNKMIEGMSFTETAKLFKDYFQLPDDIETIMEEWLEMSRHYYANEIELKPGVKELLDTLWEQGVPMGIASSCSKELILSVLNRHGIAHYFKTVVASCEVERGKPYPDVYLQAAKNMGIPSEEILAFEDTVAGVMAAKAAGMKVIAVYDEASKADQQTLREQADRYLMTLETLLEEAIATA